MISQLLEALNGIALAESAHTAEKQHVEMEQLLKTLNKQFSFLSSDLNENIL